MRLSDLDDHEVMELHGIAAAAARRKGAGDDAEDAAQAVLAKALESGREYNDLEHMKASFRRQARNKVIDWQRHGKVVEDNLGSEQVGTFTTDLVVRARMRQHISNLPEKYHDILDLTYIGGFSASEVGERLGYTEATVHKMLSEARSSLRNVVTDPKAMFRGRL